MAEPAQKLTAEKKSLVLKYLESKGKVDDSDLHEFAKSLDVHPETVEEYIYRVAGGKATKLKKKYSKEEAKRIGDSIGVDWTSTSLDQFRRGLAVETEHADVVRGSKKDLGRTVMAHLKEMGNYYTQLAKMEKKHASLAKEAMGLPNKGNVDFDNPFVRSLAKINRDLK